MMMEKGTFKNLNNRFQPPPQVCPDAAGKPIGFRNSITAFLALSSMYFLICYLWYKISNDFTIDNFSWIDHCIILFYS